MRFSRIGANREKGAEIAEFAAVVPLLFMLLFAIIWGARVFNIYETITRASREGARYAAAPTCALCGNARPTDTQIATVINNSLRASALPPTAVKLYAPTYGQCRNTDPVCTTSGTITICRGVPVGNTAGVTQQCGTAISFAYPLNLSFSMKTNVSAPMSLPALTLKTQAQMVPEQ